MPKVKELAGGKSTIVGKNKFINSKFDFWQRGASFSFGNTYTADRWLYGSAGDGGTVATGTVSRQALGAAVFEDQDYHLRLANSTQGSSLGLNSYHYFGQRIEDVKTFAGKTVTVSVWVSSSIAGKQVGFYGVQSFGSGGSTDVPLIGGAVKTLTAGVVRYDITFTVPSIVGKTIGTNNFLFFGIFLQAGTTVASFYGLPTISWSGTGNVDIVRMMVADVNGDVDFSTAGESYSNELSLCQRYFVRHTLLQLPLPVASAGTTSINRGTYFLPSEMRIAPSVTSTGFTFDGHHTSTPGISSDAKSVLFYYTGSDFRSVGGLLYGDVSFNSEI